MTGVQTCALPIWFGESSRGLQKKVKQIGKLETLDEIINKIYNASSLEEARAVVDGAAK